MCGIRQDSRRHSYMQTVAMSNGWTGRSSFFDPGGWCRRCLFLTVGEDVAG